MRRRKNIARRKCECYPDFSAELSALKDVQGDYLRLNLPGIIAKIIRKHKSNSAFIRRKMLYEMRKTADRLKISKTAIFEILHTEN